MPETTDHTAEQTTDKAAAVEAAVASGALIQRGPHYYATTDEGEQGEHVARSTAEAAAYLASLDPPSEGAPEPGAETVPEAQVETRAEAEAEPVAPRAMIYKGGRPLWFTRPGRGAGIIQPGQIVRDVPLDAPEIQRAIAASMLVDL